MDKWAIQVWVEGRFRDYSLRSDFDSAAAALAYVQSRIYAFRAYPGLRLVQDNTGVKQVYFIRQGRLCIETGRGLQEVMENYETL